MLGFLATDACIDPSVMKTLAIELAEGSFNRVTIDGDTSTNDSFIVIATIAMGILFLGGVNGRMFLLIATVLVATFAIIIAFDDLRRERILAYLDPWNPDYAQGKGHTILELAMSWLACKPFVGSVIAGATKTEQLDGNVASANWKLTAEEMAEVDALAR